MRTAGGPTQTHALPAGSIAIDAGDCAGGSITTDQRGVRRPQLAGCDIDIDSDGVIGPSDLLALLANWG